MKTFAIALGMILTALSALVPASASAAPCQAYTYCPNLGTSVSCYAYGYGCSFYVQPYQYVTCTGFNGYGYWGTFTASCF